MAVVFYIVAALALVCSIASFALIVSDIQIIVAIVFLNIALTTFGFGKLFQSNKSS